MADEATLHGEHANAIVVAVHYVDVSLRIKHGLGSDELKYIEMYCKIL